jgi:C_GCAxxG_C_C family probable redox protein
MASKKFEQAKAEAMKGYLDPGPNHLNCAQAVVRCGLVATGQDPDLTKIAGYLGGGVARMGQVCGAITGAAVTLGLRDQFAGETQKQRSVDTFAWLQELVCAFEEEFGSVTCKGLLGCDISTAEGFREAKRSKATQRCPEFVGWTCDRLAEVLDEE